MQATTNAKTFRSHFLFQTHCDGSRRRWFLLWNWGFLIAAAMGTGLLSLLLAVGRYPWDIFLGYFRHPLIAFLNILPVVLLILLLYCLVNRAWIAFLAGPVPVMLASVGNYFKIVCRDDPFMFADIPDITTALGISERYDLSMNWRLGFCLFCVIPLVKVYTSDDIYDNKTQNYEHADQWAAPQVFLTRGFIYPFLYSIKEAFPEPPEGYSEEAALEILTSYEAQDIPEEKKVNVIGIQLEAFNDLERLGVEGIAPEVYEKYRALEAESYAGDLITNIFAGGTVRTERSFLTGDVTLEDFRRDTGSYVWYFKDQGYVTEGIHPYHDYYYNRKNVNSYLGFDEYWFFQNRYDALNDGHIAMDDVLFPDLLQFYQNRVKDTPYFNFTVTYQGHGPYATDALEGTDGWWDGTYSDESTYYILNNYLNSVQETAGQLWDFIQALREDEDPVVVVVFGDHNPWLGYSNSAYHDLGVNLDTSTEEGFYNYYGTRYLIWANDAAKETLNNDFTGEGPDVSPCFLMNVLFEQCGWGSGSAYMQLTGEVMEQIPVINTDGFYVENGRVTTALSDTAQELFSRLEIAQFYRKQHSEW